MELRFMIYYKGKKFKKYINNTDIKLQIKNIKKSLNNYYRSKDLVIICVLNGSVVLLSELLKNAKFRYELDYIELSSYKGDTKTSGTVEIVQDIKTNLSNKYVLLIEDIVDSGTTLNFLYNKINYMNPKEVRIFSLLFKKSKYKFNIKIDWYSFIIKDLFVIGFGMDYEYKFRGLKDIYYLVEDENNL